MPRVIWKEANTGRMTLRVVQCKREHNIVLQRARCNVRALLRNKAYTTFKPYTTLLSTWLTPRINTTDVLEMQHGGQWLVSHRNQSPSTSVP